MELNSTDLYVYLMKDFQQGNPCFQKKFYNFFGRQITEFCQENFRAWRLSYKKKRVASPLI